MNISGLGLNCWTGIETKEDPARYKLITTFLFHFINSFVSWKQCDLQRGFRTCYTKYDSCKYHSDQTKSVNLCFPEYYESGIIHCLFANISRCCRCISINKYVNVSCQSWRPTQLFISKMRECHTSLVIRPFIEHNEGILA